MSVTMEARPSRPPTIPTTQLECGFACTVTEETTDKIPFKSSTFCDNLNSGFRYDVYFFRSDVERRAFTNFCGMTCGEISAAVCGGGGGNNSNVVDTSFEWTPTLFKSVYRDCCNGYETSCSYCQPGTELSSPNKLTTNNGTGFNATCSQFNTWFDLEWWSHSMGETLDSYGPDSGNPRRSCSELRYRDPIWSPIREWESLENDCACVEPMPSLSPSQTVYPTIVPSPNPTMTSIPTTTTRPSKSPSYAPSQNPSYSASPSFQPTDTQECSPDPSQTFSSIGGLTVGFYVALFYGLLFFFKSKNANRPRWGIYEMTSEVFGQFTATVMAVGTIFICLDYADEHNFSAEEESSMTIMSMVSLLAVDGFEMILTMITVPFIGPEDHPGESFDMSRWNNLEGCSMFVARFLIWCIGSGLPLVILFFDDVIGESRPVMVLCFISLGMGMLVGFFGPCVLRKPDYAGRGARLLWVLVKNLVGVIPGLIIAIANKEWIALGWGAEAFIEISHWLGEQNFCL